VHRCAIEEVQRGFANPLTVKHLEGLDPATLIAVLRALT